MFGPDHLAALACVVGISALVIGRGKALSPAVRAGVRIAFILFLSGYAVSYYALAVQARGWNWASSLPLSLCDWVLIACLVALARRDGTAFEIAYFWGFAGTLQGMLTPDLRTGFPTFRYFHFFWGHGGILLALVWMIAAEGLHPRRGGIWRAFLGANVYLVVVGALNGLFGWNYGYICRPPAQFSLLRYMGPWPWYLVTAEIVALLSFWLLDLPWKIARRRAGKRSGDERESLPGNTPLAPL